MALMGLVWVVTAALALGDLPRFSWRLLGLALVPHILLLGMWGLYLWSDVEGTREQMAWQMNGRGVSVSQPLLTLGRELREKYWELYAGWRPGVPLAMRLKSAFLFAWIASLVAVLLDVELRRQRAVRILLGIVILSFLLACYLDPWKLQAYLIHVIPAFTALFAVVAAHYFMRAPRTGGLLVVGMCAFGAASIMYRVRQDVLGRAFEPAVAYLRARIQPSDLVFAPAEFGFGLDFATHVSADPSLGQRSGRVARFVVIDRMFADALEHSRQTDPVLTSHVDRILSDAKKVFTSEVGEDRYVVYELAARPNPGIVR